MKVIKANENIFSAFGYDELEAANLQIRAALILELTAFIEAQGFTQRKAASFFGIHAPRINDLMNRRIDKFTIDALVNMATKTGKTVTLHLEEKKAA